VALFAGAGVPASGVGRGTAPAGASDVAGGVVPAGFLRGAPCWWGASLGAGVDAGGGGAGVLLSGWTAATGGACKEGCRGSNRRHVRWCKAGN
jgi:hypothetical protein